MLHMINLGGLRWTGSLTAKESSNPSSIPNSRSLHATQNG